MSTKTNIWFISSWRIISIYVSGKFAASFYKHFYTALVKVLNWDENYPNGQESKTDNKVGHPVDSDGDRCSHRTSRRIEQFCYQEPRNRTGTSGKHYHVDYHQDDAKVWQPRCHVLFQLKKNNWVLKFHPKKNAPTLRLTRRRAETKLGADSKLVGGDYTLSARQMVRRIRSTNIPPRPTSCRVLRPAFSMMTSETRVMSTFIPPIPSVAYCEVCGVRPAEIKMAVEKYIT